MLRWKEPDAPRAYRVPGYPWVPAIFVGFAVLFLGMIVWNDISGYRAAVAAGKPGMINSAFGTALVVLGAPLYFL